MKEFFKAIIRFFMGLFSSKEIEAKKFVELSSIPKKGDKSDDVKLMKVALNKHAAGLDPENNYFGSTTREKVKEFQKGQGLEVTGEIDEKTLKALGLILKVPEVKAEPIAIHVNPAYLEAKKYAGQKETDKKLQDKLVPVGKKITGKWYTTLVGASFAWCAVFFFSMNSDVGQEVIASAGAKKIGQSGYEINWKRDGIPQGAGVWKNSSSCSSSSGNHITWADGDCSAADLMKPKATWPGFGGNQGNAVKRSIYCAKGDCKESKDVICRVFWHVKELPPSVKVSKNCSGSASEESTR